MTRRPLIALCGVLLLAATATVPASAAGCRPIVLWQDDFTGPAGAPPDPARWRVDEGTREYGDLETYRNGPETIGLTGQGQLRITAVHNERGYESARVLGSPRTFLPPEHGSLHISAAVRAAPGAGVGTSFWTWGTDVASWPANGEIDVAENLGREPDRVRTAIQCPTCHDDAPPYGLTTVYPAPDHSPYSGGSHTFAVDWRRGPDSITWYVDGRPVATRTPADTGPEGWVFDQPMFLVLAVRVGGPFVGDPDPAAFPATALVDRIAVSRSDG